MESPFWNEILLLFFRAISLTSCFPPQQQSTQWVSQRYRPLSGLVFIYLFIHFWIPSVYWLYNHSLLSFVFENTLFYFLPLFLTLLWITYLAFFSCYLCCLISFFTFFCCLHLAVQLLLHSGGLWAAREVGVKVDCRSIWAFLYQVD